MDNLNNIPHAGNWGDAASKLNDNFNKVQNAITTVENTHKNNKGYFPSELALNTAFPNPKSGETAYVFSESSSTNYYIFNAVGGGWVTSSIEAPAVGVNLAGYTKTGGSTKTTKQLDDEIIQLESEITDELIQLAGDVSAGVINMSPNLEEYADLQTMLQSVPANKRKRGQSIIWKSPDKWYTHKMQNVGNPAHPTVYENPIRWLDTSNSTPIFVEFDTDRTTTRLSIPVELRFNGMTISYMEDGKLRIEHYYDHLGRVLNTTNFSRESLWYNLTDEDIITQEMGDSSDLAVSQKTITSEIEAITSEIGALNNKKMDNDKYVENLSKNLFDKSAIQMDKGFNYLNNIVNIANAAVSDWIKVNNGQIYTLTTGFSSDVYKRMVKFAEYGDTESIGVIENTGTFTSDFDGYVCFTVASTATSPPANHADIIQLERGSIATDYEPYTLNEKIKEQYIPNSEIQITPIEAYDKRLLQSFRLEKDVFIENKQFLDSVRKLKANNNVDAEVNLFIPNTYGEELKDVVMPIHVHRGQYSNINDTRHIYFNNDIKEDFSDLRCFVGDEMLDMTIESRGNYSFFPIQFPKASTIIEHSGEYYYTVGKDIVKSIDLVSYTVILTDLTLAFIDADGNIYGKQPLSNNLFKYYKETNYTTSKSVIDNPPEYTVVNWRYLNYATDILGHMYIATYQYQNDARIFKSTDMGETWFLVMDSTLNDSQHCHNLIIDKSITPNRIYASFDGNVYIGYAGAGSTSQWYSDDYGETWVRDDLTLKLGYAIDSGIGYAKGNELIAVGEAAIKSNPSISISLDGGDTWDKKLFNQNTFQVSEIGDLKVIAGCNYVSAKTSNIYGTYNLKDWFTINQIVDIDPVNIGTGDGYRYGSYNVISDPDGGECLIMVSNNNNHPVLKGKVGGDYYSAMVLVKIPTLPLTGVNLSFKNNYAVSEPKRNLFNADLTPKYSFPLSERTALIDYGELKDNPQWSYKFNSYGLNLESFVNVPFSKMGLVKNTDIYIDQAIELQGSFSVSFWYGLPNVPRDERYFDLIEIGDFITRFSSTNRFNVTVLEFSDIDTRTIRSSSLEFPRLITIVFNLMTDEITIYNDNWKSRVLQATGLNTASKNRLKVGYALPNPNPYAYISDLRIYDKILSHNEVNLIFNKANLL